MKSGVFDVPTRPDDAERHLATDLAGALADDGETPGRWLFLVRLGDHGADRADFSFVGIQRLDVIDVPELHVFFPVRIVAALTPSLDLPEVEGVRVGKKVVQRFIRYVGREADGRTILSCSMSDAEVDEVKLSGPLMMLHSLATRIGLPSLLGEYANEILALTYAHCMDYKSLNHMQEWFERTDLNLILELEQLTERRLVGALDALESFDAMTLLRAIFENTKRVLGVKTHGVVYDVTNTYFHGKRCQLARFVNVKVNRKDYLLFKID